MYVPQVGVFFELDEGRNEATGGEGAAADRSKSNTGCCGNFFGGLQRHEKPFAYCQKGHGNRITADIGTLFTSLCRIITAWLK